MGGSVRRIVPSGAAYVALLRGINVGGKHCLPMKDLAALFEQAGCRAVRTWIQSGNVVFRAPASVARLAPALVERAIRERYGFAAPVIARSAAELREVVERNPFAGAADDRHLHVVFLAAKPTAARVAALDPDRSPPDEFRVAAREIYLRCPDGIGRTRLTNAWFDAGLATVSTTRNWNTVRNLLELAG